MYNALIEANVGKIVDLENTGRQYTIAGFADKEGTMKDGKKAPYMLLLWGDLENGAHFHPIHPETAKTLCKKGSTPGMRIIEAPVQPVEEPTVTTVVEAVQNVVETATIDSTVEAVVTVKAESKKAGAIRIFNEELSNLNGDSLRARVIARFKAELALSAPGSATYYQNIKSGAWK